MTTHAGPFRKRLRVGFWVALVLCATLPPSPRAWAQPPPDEPKPQESAQDDADLFEELEVARTRVDLLEMKLKLEKQQYNNTLQQYQMYANVRTSGGMGFGGMGGGMGGFSATGALGRNAEDPAIQKALKEERDRQEAESKKTLETNLRVYRESLEKIKDDCLETSKQLGRARHQLAERERRASGKRHATGTMSDPFGRLDEATKRLDAVLEALKKSKGDDRGAKP